MIWTWVQVVHNLHFSNIFHHFFCRNNFGQCIPSYITFEPRKNDPFFSKKKKSSSYSHWTCLPKPSNQVNKIFTSDIQLDRICFPSKIKSIRMISKKKSSSVNKFVFVCEFTWFLHMQLFEWDYFFFKLEFQSIPKKPLRLKGMKMFYDFWASLINKFSLLRRLINVNI